MLETMQSQPFGAGVNRGLNPTRYSSAFRSSGVSRPLASCTMISRPLLFCGLALLFERDAKDNGLRGWERDVAAVPVAGVELRTEERWDLLAQER